MTGFTLYVVDGDDLIRLFLPEGFSTDFEWFNPALSNSEIPSEISLDVKIPIEGNELALKQSHHVETTRGDSLFQIRGFVDDQPRINGQLFIEESAYKTDSDFFDCSIIASDFNSLIQGKTLREVCDKTVLIGDGAGGVYDQIKFMNEGDSNQYACAFPVMLNTKHYGGENTAFNGIINPWLQSAQLQIQTGVLETGNSYYSNEYTYVPTLYLKYVLERISEFTGWSIGGAALLTAEMKKVILFSNYGIEKNRNGYLGILRKTSDQDITNGYVFFDEIIEDEDGTIVTGPQPYEIGERGIHQFHIELVIGNIAAGAATLHVKTGGISGEGFEVAIPSGNQVIVIDQEHTFATSDIGDSLGCLIDSGGQNIEILTNTLFKGINVTESSAFSIPKNFNAKNCVPKMGVGEFLVAVRNWLNLKITMDPITKSLNFEFIKQILTNDPFILTGEISESQPIEFVRKKQFTVSLSNQTFEWNQDDFIGEFNTLDDLPDALSKQVAMVRNLASYYIFDINETEDALRWRFFALANTEFSFGEGEQVTISIPGELVRMEVLDELAALQVVPVFDEAGSGDTYDLGIKDGKLRLGFYHGLKAGSVGNYPFASTSNIDMNGNTVSEWSFLMEDVDGIGSVLYGNWKTIMQSIQTLSKTFVGKLDMEEAGNRIILLNNQEYMLESAVRTVSDQESPIELKLRKKPVS